MTMLIRNLSELGNDPMAWALVGVVALLFLLTMWNWVRCETFCRERVVTPEEAAAHQRRRITAGPRLAVMSAIGIGLTVTGLWLVTNGLHSAVAFGLILAGVYILQTEPYRHQGREAEMQVVLARSLGGGERLETAVQRLRAAHMRLMLVSLALTLAAAGVLMAF